jgi:hypothetical protein
MNHAVRNFIHAVSAAAVAAIVLTPAAAQGQTLFEPLGAASSKSITMPAGTTPLGVAVADFNHDGYPDIVVANKADTSLGTSGTISVYLASGPGTFQAATTYPTCGGPTAVIAEDLDLTGLPDIAITCNSPTSNAIELFLNLGNGTFNPVVDDVTNIVLGTGPAPVAIASGDFNKDGHPDLAVANSGDGTVTLLLSNAASNFGMPTIKTLTGLGTPTGIATGNFSTSGNLDLAVVDSASQTVRVLTGDGAGNFTPGATPATGTNPTGIVAGDLNHDGLADLAVANAGSGTVSVLLNQGNGTFATSSTVSVGPTTGTGASAIIAFDVLGDGNLDLLTGNTLQNTFSVLINRGNGSFQAAQDYAVPNGPAYLAAGDFNRDGKPDLAVTQSTGAAVSVLINNTLPTPAPGAQSFFAPNVIPNANGNMADGIVAADFNHDGYPDTAVSYMEDNSVRVLIATGLGQNFNTSFADYPVGAQPYSVATGDLNNDGYADLVTANAADKTISVLMNKGNGSGTFAAAVSYPVGWLPYQVAIGDLNGDGIPDLAVTDYGDNTVSILYGQPGGTFTSGQTLATCTNPYGAAIGDFRHSGQNDIAITCYKTAQMEVFLNNGMLPFQAPPAQTTFQSPGIYSTDVYPASLVVGDFNRDGKLDIVTGNSTANDISFFGGNGNGTFQAGITSPSLSFPQSIAAGDINGDGILDIVAVAPNFDQIAIALGKGDGTFGTLQQRDQGRFNAGQQPWAVALADFNNDGKLDIITANTYNRVNLAIPAYQQMYMNKFPPVPGGNPSLNVMINTSGTNISLTTSPSGTIPYNEPVTVTATVASPYGGATPTGTVIFQDSNGLATGAIPLSGGSASATVNNLGSGTHEITVLYSGDVLYQPYTATGPSFIVNVAGTPVALAIQPNPITPTTTVSYSVTIGTATPGGENPVGTITLFASGSDGTVVQADGPNSVGTAGTGGVTTFSKTLTTSVPAGNYYVYAVFTPAAGNNNPAGSSPNILLVSQ